MQKEVKLPKHPGDRSEYFLVSVERAGDYFKTVHRREGVEAAGHSVTIIDCKNNRYQDLAYDDSELATARIYPERDWVDLVEGSSKWRLAKFVCERHYKQPQP